MPKFTLPKPKKAKDTKSEPIDFDEYYNRKIYMPANKAVLDATEVGEDVTVVLKGKVVAKELRENESGGERSEFTVEIVSVEVGTMNEFEKMSMEDD